MVKVYEERWYQDEAAEAMFEAIVSDESCYPIIAVPTGGGKTVILAKVIKKYLNLYPDNEVTVLSHTEDIVVQDAKTLEEFMPDTTIGVFNAGVGRKEKEQVTVGSIQSVYNSQDLFTWTNLYIVDEAHAISHKEGEGRYRTLFENSHAQVAGMSATIFRTGHGYVHKGEGALFNKLAYDLSSSKNFSRLVKEGYLCPLIAVQPKNILDSTNVKKTGGDFNLKALAKEHNITTKTRACIQEAKEYGKNYKKWLVFAIDIDHADSITRILNANGIRAHALHSKNKKLKSKILAAYRRGDIRALVSVGMVTTGFDEPAVDLILMLRPTTSPVIHVQTLGRGTRVFPGKSHTLVLDYANNTNTLGPIDNVVIPKPKSKDAGEGVGDPITIVCSKCNTINYAAAKKCHVCGHVFPREVKLLTSASTSAIMSSNKPWEPELKEKWIKVKNVGYRKVVRYNAPNYLEVSYMCGVQVVKEFWLLEHNGVAGKIAAYKANYRGFEGKPSVDAVFNARNRLKTPKEILVNYEEAYPKVKSARF